MLQYKLGTSKDRKGMCWVGGISLTSCARSRRTTFALYTSKYFRMYYLRHLHGRTTSRQLSCYSDPGTGPRAHAHKNRSQARAAITCGEHPRNGCRIERWVDLDPSLRVHLTTELVRQGPVDGHRRLVGHERQRITRPLVKLNSKVLAVFFLENPLQFPVVYFHALGQLHRQLGRKRFIAVCVYLYEGGKFPGILCKYRGDLRIAERALGKDGGHGGTSLFVSKTKQAVETTFEAGLISA